MSKSNYPSSLDTSREIPPVRDNITEIGSEIINSLRSAIFNIEQTLGINPQGSSGNTVASRINSSIDESGNIRKDALTLANVLSGPIVDTDVSNVAAISEAKLRLTFPTQVLQDEISILSSEIMTFADQIEALNAVFSAHIYPGSINRHLASAITVEEAVVSASATAFTGLAGESLQASLESLINGHINFDGTVSSTNTSHRADQLFFDKSNVSDVVFQDSVQGAVEDLANLEGVGLRNHALNLSSNGRIRTGSITDGYEALGLGDVVVASASVSFVREGSRTRFSFNSAQTPLNLVEVFDILNLSNSDTDADNKGYQIVEIITSGVTITAVIVLGTPLGDSTSGLSASISKNPYVVYNANGLNCTVRPRADYSNTPDVVIANPNSATIISNGIMPSKITVNENAFGLAIDGKTVVQISTYDNNVSEQTLSSVVNKINEQSVEQNLNFLAYKLKQGDCYELALTHILPNVSSDIINRTLKVSAGSTNDGTTELGLIDSLDLTIEGNTGNGYLINGLLLDSFGQIITLTSDDIEIISGTNTLSLFSGTFIALGVRVGDLVVITGSDSSTDDGTYRISNISSGIITLDSVTLSLAGDLGASGSIYIIRATAAIDEMNFTESVSSQGSIMFDIFITEDSDIHYHKRLEIDGAIYNNGFAAIITDVSRGFLLSSTSATVTVNTSGMAYLTDPSLQSGQPIYVGQTGQYKLLASDGLSFVSIAVYSSGIPTVQQVVDLYGFDEVSSNNYRVCRGTFSTSLGRVLGEYNGIGVPSVLDKRQSGTVDDTIISENVLERYIEGPRNELRASGVVRGLEVTNLLLIDSGEVDSFGSAIYYHEVDISAGIIYISGIRYEIAGYSSFRFNTSDDFYIGINTSGCVVYGEQITNPDGYTDGYTDQISSLADQDIIHLAFIDATTTTITDLRYFIDRLDLKSGKIVVSKTQNFGHFTEVAPAIEYAKRFTELHPGQGTPIVYIDQGDFSISSTIIIDCDIKICGAGPDTVLTKSGAFAFGTTPNSGNIDFGDALFLVGADTKTGSNRIINGVTFEDFTYHTSDDISAVGCVISITQPLVKLSEPASNKATFRVQNVNFIGSDNIAYGTGIDADLVGEYAIAVGQADEITFIPESSIIIGGLVMGNLIVTGCRFHKMGVEYGGITFPDSVSFTIQNVIVCNNIATDMSPVVASVGFDIIETMYIVTLSNVIEANNART